MRHKFKRDDDGHWYLIPADMQEQFNSMEAEGEKDYYAEFNNTFEQYRCEHPCNYSFADPGFD